MTGEGGPPGVIGGGQVGGDGDRLGIGLPGAVPVAAMIEDVAAEAIAVDVAAGCLQHRVGLVGMSRRFLGGRGPAGVAGVVAGDDRIAKVGQEGLHLGRRPDRVAGLFGDAAMDEVGHGGDAGV